MKENSLLQKPFSLSVVFPAFNEEKNISATIKEATGVAESLTQDFEIIIVDDGSTDSTRVVLAEEATKNPKLRTITHQTNQGYGAAVWSGITASTKEYVFFSDSDLQFKLDELAGFIQHLLEYDAVLGYRAKRQDPFMRLLDAKAWNLLNRLLFGLKIKDIDCAFKLFKAGFVKDLPIRSRGAMFSAELLILLKNRGAKIKELPVTHLPRKAGSPTGAKLTVIFRALREMFKVYRRNLRVS